MNKLISNLKDFYSENEKIQVTAKLEIYFMIFFSSCIAGWIYEEIFYLVTENILEKRGFLYGPYLPIYGFGALLILFLLERLKKYPPVFFLSSILVTGSLEYITGLMMWKIWHRRWWDYTGTFLNLDGYVSFRSTMTFAIMGLFLIYIFKPVTKHFIIKMSPKARAAMCITIMFALSIDLILTLIFRNPV